MRKYHLIAVEFIADISRELEYSAMNGPRPARSTVFRLPGTYRARIRIAARTGNPGAGSTGSARLPRSCAAAASFRRSIRLGAGRRAAALRCKDAAGV